MRNRNDLTDALADIGQHHVATGFNDPDFNADRRFAPTLWDMVKDDPSKFAATWDFEVAGSIFIPLSEAAKTWAFSKLPSELTQHWDFKAEAFGYDVGDSWIKFICHRASQDKLISENDWREAQEEFHRSQWDDQQITSNRRTT